MAHAYSKFYNIPSAGLRFFTVYGLEGRPGMAYFGSTNKLLMDEKIRKRFTLSNNAAENAIRPFTVGRKNWLFADSTKGADASAAVYSIIETAKANNLNVYTYLEYLLLYMPDTDWRNNPEELDNLMPWSDAVRNVCGN